MSRRYSLIVLVVCLVSMGGALGEIEKLAYPSATGFCFVWWPKLPAVEGWHQEEDSSREYSSNCLAPDGSTFADAETVMYARAMYKPRTPEIHSVEELIKSDRQGFLDSNPETVISPAAMISTGDEQRFRSFTFFPKTTGNWERVSYGEEDDFFLIFTISSRSQNGYRKSLPAYQMLIERYRKHITESGPDKTAMDPVDESHAPAK